MGVVEWLLVFAVLTSSSTEENASHVIGKPGPVPGASHNISTNNSGVQHAATLGAYAFNNQSNDLFLFKVLAIEGARIQVVRGVNYLLDVTIQRTVCRKMEHPVNLDKCHFQPKGDLHQTFQCHFVVWAVPWQHWIKVTFFTCRP